MTRPSERADREEDPELKNPWMSAWLSAAGTMSAAARGQIAAETSRQQTAMTKAWAEAATAFWMAAMFPWLPRGGKRK